MNRASVWQAIRGEIDGRLRRLVDRATVQAATPGEATVRRIAATEDDAPRAVLGGAMPAPGADGLVLAWPGLGSVFAPLAGGALWHARTRDEIQAAVDAANAAGGGCVLVDVDGTVAVATTIVLKSNVHLRGLGWGTRLVPAASMSTAVIASASGQDLHNAWVTDLTIDGTGVTGLTTGNHGVLLYQPMWCEVQRVKVDKVGGSAVRIEGNPSFEAHVTGVRGLVTDQTGSHGVHVSSNGDGIMEGCEIGRSGGLGVIEGMQDLGVHGVYGYSVGQWKFFQNHVHQSAGHNILIEASFNTAVIANRCEEAARHGIACSGLGDAQVVANYCRSNGQVTSGDGGSGIWLYNSYRNLVAANKCMDTNATKTQVYGIREGSPATDNHYVGNHLRDNLTGEALYVDGTNRYDRAYASLGGGAAVLDGGATPTLVFGTDTGFWRNAANELRSLDQFSILGGVATKTKSGAPSDADFATPVDGLTCLDTTNHRWYARSGGVWRYAQLT